MVEVKNKILQILDGIDKTQTEYENGWWETSAGAEFGKNKLEELLVFLDKTLKDKSDD